MIEQDLRHHVWVEKYRPQSIDDCVLPEAIKVAAKGYAKQGKLPNLLFTGTAGVGKTTLAKALCDEIGADVLYINASMENGIDVVRTKIQQFASTVSFSDAKKVTILDEFDGTTPQFQAAIRAFSEQFAHNHSFIFTCNFKNRIIEPIHSRCSVIEFKIPNAEKPKLATQFFKRVTEILDNEKIEYDKKVVAEVVQKHFPDFRRCLNELQRHSASGKIDSSVLIDFTEDSLNQLIKILKDKKFNDLRKWLANNSDIDSTHIFRMFYDNASEKMESKSIPSLVLMIGEYQYKAAFVADQEINLCAFFTELMLSEVVWK